MELRGRGEEGGKEREGKDGRLKDKVLYWHFFFLTSSSDDCITLHHIFKVA